MKSLPVGLALAAGLLAGCTTLTPVASIKATVNAPDFPAAAKVYVDGRSFPRHGRKITREFSERYGTGYRETLEERYAALLAGGDLWAKREAARIEAHANFAPTVAAEFAARGHVLVPRDEADYLVSFSFSAVPWEESMGSDRLPDIDDPKQQADLFLETHRNPRLPDERFPTPAMARQAPRRNPGRAESLPPDSYAVSRPQLRRSYALGPLTEDTGMSVILRPPASVDHQKQERRPVATPAGSRQGAAVNSFCGRVTVSIRVQRTGPRVKTLRKDLW